MATTSLGTYRNAVKPVGEQILVDFVNSAQIAVLDAVAWDYDIPTNLVLTDFMIVKTGADIPANCNIDVSVLKVDKTGAETVIATLRLPTATTKGTIVRAVLDTPNGNTGLLANGSAGTLESRLVAVQSQSLGATATSNSQQAIRIKIAVLDIAVPPVPSVPAAAGEAAMFIKLNLARFSSVQSKFDEIVTVQS